MDIIKKGIELVKEKNHHESRAIINLDVLLITSQKTASTAIFNSLNKLNINTTHLHSLDHFYLYNDKTLNYFIKNFNDIIEYNNKINKKTPIVMSVYREPFGRLISFYLYNQLKDKNPKLDLNLNVPYRLIIGSMPICTEDIFQGVFAKKFDHNLNYHNIDKETHKIYIFKFDKLNAFENLVKRYLNNNFCLEKDNKTEDFDKDLYDNFMKNYKMPLSMFKILLWLEEEVMDFFYTPEDKQKIINMYKHRVYNDNKTLNFPTLEKRDTIRNIYNKKREWVLKHIL
jgi:hypothetical protein